MVDLNSTQIHDDVTIDVYMYHVICEIRYGFPISSVMPAGVYADGGFGRNGGGGAGGILFVLFGMLSQRSPSWGMNVRVRIWQRWTNIYCMQQHTYYLT